MDAKLAKSAIEASISEARERVRAIKAVPDGALNYENCLSALDNCADTLDRVWNWLNHLQSVADSPELRRAVNENTPAATGFYASLRLDGELYAKVSAYSKSDEGRSLSGYKARLLSETLLDFELGGAALPSDKKKRLLEISSLLSQKTQKFSENALDDTKAFSLRVDDEKDLDGLPQSAVRAAAEKAKETGTDGWVFTLDAPSYTPFMSYSNRADLREKLWRAFSEIGRGGGRSNAALIREILSLRDEEAKILGRANFADEVLARRMAGCGKRALEFVEGLHSRFKDAFDAQWGELLDFAKPLGILENGLMPPWSFAYATEKLRREKYDFDPESLRPYFPFERVKEGMFEICRKLYGVRIRKFPGRVKAWHPSVELYEFYGADGKLTGMFYADFFPRKSKRSGAWMNLLRPASGGLPALGVVAGNISPASGGVPPLLSHGEVETLFHEFGHLLHFFTMDCPALGLRDVAWDFVELPSQLMENWCRNRECLDIFAAHWRTGEKIPDDLFEKFEKSRKFMGAVQAMRQLSFAKIDLDAHIDPGKFISAPDLDGLAEDLLRGYTHEYSRRVPSILPRFTHIFGDAVGYAAGYYSYKWAEVLDADVFTRFEREGVLNPRTGADFAEKILRTGNTVDPAQAFRNFMGRDPEPGALIRRSV